MKKIIDFLRDEEGAALPEYALLVALIAVVSIIAITAVGTSVSEKMQEIADEIN
jgi:pilus assembly protein Flp/PilA